MPENFQVPAALDEMYFFHSTTLFVVTKNSSHSPFSAGIWQISSSLWWNAFFHATNYNFKPGIVSYPNYWKTVPSMSQLIHKCRKNHAINSSRHYFISCGTTCKKLHFTYLFFYQTTRSFAAVLITSWNFFTQWTSFQEVDSSCFLQQLKY